MSTLQPYEELGVVNGAGVLWTGIDRPRCIRTPVLPMRVQLLRRIPKAKTSYFAYISHRFSRRDLRSEPTEREHITDLRGEGYFWKLLPGRRVSLVTDCSALTWLFRSRDFSPKLHRLALLLTEYDIVLQWQAGAENFMPDVFLGPSPPSRG